MSFEIEQKYRCPDHGQVLARLRELGAVRKPTVRQEDTYLNHPSRDFAQSGEALRVRRSGDQNAITYKGPKREGPTKTRLELELPFAPGAPQAETLLRLFGSLGFTAVSSVGKTRTPFHIVYEGRPVEVVLDEAEGLGTFVEVEALAADEADLPRAQDAVIKLSATLGLTDLEPRSYLRMALEQGGTRPDV